MCIADYEENPPLWNTGHDDDDVDVGNRRQIPAHAHRPQRTA